MLSTSVLSSDLSPITGLTIIQEEDSLGHLVVVCERCFSKIDKQFPTRPSTVLSWRCRSSTCSMVFVFPTDMPDPVFYTRWMMHSPDLTTLLNWIHSWTGIEVSDMHVNMEYTTT